jgi:hypothetical protein
MPSEPMATIGCVNGQHWRLLKAVLVGVLLEDAQSLRCCAGLLASIAVCRRLAAARSRVT